MPLEIVRNDITAMRVDAIVNAANASLLGGDGVDGAIHRAAGPGLLAECATLGGCETGSAKITRGYDLNCKYVIHAVGPIWRGGLFRERTLLTACYRKALALARDHNCDSVAFPLLSSGAYGYPKDKALEVAVAAIGEFLLHNEMRVFLVIYDRSAYQLSQKLSRDIRQYIDEHYVETHTDAFEESRRAANLSRALSMEAPRAGALEPCAAPSSLADALNQMEESFSEMLLRKIDERGLTDAACYKRANIDRKLFSKIRSNKGYRPSKPTVLAFAIALELSLEETRDMLRRAGFALSHSDKFDVIVEYFIQNRNYNIFEINEALFAFEQGLLGA